MIYTTLRNRRFAKDLLNNLVVRTLVNPLESTESESIIARKETHMEIAIVICCFKGKPPKKLKPCQIVSGCNLVRFQFFLGGLPSKSTYDARATHRCNCDYVRAIEFILRVFPEILRSYLIYLLSLNDSNFQYSENTFLTSSNFGVLQIAFGGKTGKPPKSCQIGGVTLF